MKLLKLTLIEEDYLLKDRIANKLNYKMPVSKNPILFFNFDETIFNHHPQGLNVFRYLFVFPNFNEGMTIFSNNIILISGFYYLFYERKLILYEKFFLYCRDKPS